MVDLPLEKLQFFAAACPLQLLQLACQKVEAFWQAGGDFLDDSYKGIPNYKVVINPKKAYLTP